MEKEKLISLVDFIEFCRTRKGKAPPSSPFVVECLYAMTKHISGMGYIECTEYPVTLLPTFKTENVVIVHSNGNKTTIFLRSTNYCWCIAWEVDVSRHRRQRCRFSMLRRCYTPHTSSQMLAKQNPILQNAVHFRASMGKYSM